MIPINEAKRKLIEEGYTVSDQSPYRELLILNAKYDTVRDFLNSQGYTGDIIVLGKIKGFKADLGRPDDEVDNYTTKRARTPNRAFYESNNNGLRENEDGQYSLF